MRAGFLIATALSGSGMMACSAAASEQGTDTSNAGTTTATAVVVIERSSGPGDAVHGDSVTARFVRVRQGTVDDPALRMAGVAEDLPALGTCADPAVNTAGVAGRGIDLLDVGSITVSPVGEAVARPMTLLPRTMPDPAGVVSGVFYSSRSTEPVAANGTAARVTLHASGGADLQDGFTTSVTVPHDLGEVRVVPFSAGNGSSLDITWDADGADAHDLVWADVLSPSVARCATADTGHLVVTHPALGADEGGQITLHRLHKEGFRAKGIEPGEIRFDVSKIATFRR